ncbi:MAG: chorismate synthase, partial [Bacteroidales bacterium]|nr:chorismate synthase [Bacteroidales bacterium]
IEVGGKNPREDELQAAMAEGDSLGGLIECVATNMPAGLGEPFFNSVESLISHIIFAIPGVRGIEFGDGFAAAAMKGSEHNDPFIDKHGKTSKNGAGGINGGISNGNDIVFRVAVKPTSSISKSQLSYNSSSGKMEEHIIPGRHDTCFALRVPPVVEAAAAIVLADLFC